MERGHFLGDGGAREIYKRGELDLRNDYVGVCKKWMDSSIFSVVVCTCNRTERGFAVVLDPHNS